MGVTVCGYVSRDTGVNKIRVFITLVDEDLKHPPHIHNLDVECSKTMMTINIEFNRAFDGVIYSKVGFAANRSCEFRSIMSPWARLLGILHESGVQIRGAEFWPDAVLLHCQPRLVWNAIHQ